MLLLLSACSDRMAEVSDNTTEIEITRTVTESSFFEETIAEETSEIETTETETTPIPTVANDLDYYEMYKIGLDRIEKLDVSNGEFQKSGEEYAKKWTSTDGKISFVLDTLYGPFGSARKAAIYTVDGIEYDTEVSINPFYFEMYIETWDSYTVILSGTYEYDHDEQSFTVTASGEIFSSYIDDNSPISIDDHNAKHGDINVPIYSKGEKVTFKMIK